MAVDFHAMKINSHVLSIHAKIDKNELSVLIFII